MGRQLWIADKCREWGLTVQEVPGWQDRGSSSFNPRGVVAHHTGGPSSGDYPSLPVIVNGRQGPNPLSGPLSQVGLGRSGTVYVIASGRANHAGPGGWLDLSGNSSVLGIEAESVGTRDDWTDIQRQVYPRLCAALLDGIGATADYLCGHKEWAPTRKPDPAYFDMPTMRADVARLLTAGSVALPATGTDSPRTEVGPTGPPPDGSLIIGGRIFQPSQLRIFGEQFEVDATAVKLSLERSIDEADRLTATFRDPHRELLRHPKLREKSTVAIDGVIFELTDVRKTDAELQVTWTDAAAVDLNRPVDDVVTQAPGTATRGDFMRRLVGLSPWVKSDIEPGLTTQVPLALGTTGLPDETPWQALGRLAREVGWRRCAVGNRVLIGSDAWLGARRPAIAISEWEGGIDTIDFVSQFGVPADDATVHCDAGLWAAPPTSAVELSGMGFADGVWLVSRFRRDDLASTRARVSLQRTRPALDEPTPPPDLGRYDPVDDFEGTATTSGTSTTAPSNVTERGLSWPLQGAITSPYGPRSHPITGQTKMHYGVDIAAQTYTTVRACHDGTVVEQSRNDVAGLYVRIRLDDDAGNMLLQTRYLHLQEPGVRVGQQVKRGEYIGASGATGAVTGPHLHLELKVDGVLVDPEDYLPTEQS